MFSIMISKDRCKYYLFYIENLGRLVYLSLWFIFYYFMNYKCLKLNLLV